MMPSRWDEVQANIDLQRVTAERDSQKTQKDAAYLERNKLVALLASLFPSGIAKTAIEDWSEDWHGCVYVDLPGFQASWHYHDSHAHLFEHLPPYRGEWDGHTTEEKYEKIVEASNDLIIRDTLESLIGVFTRELVHALSASQERLVEYSSVLGVIEAQSNHSLPYELKDLKIKGDLQLIETAGILNKYKEVNK